MEPPPPTDEPTSTPTGAPTSSVQPYPCDSNSLPLQLLETEKGSRVWVLKELAINPSDTTYSDKYEIKTPLGSIHQLNGASISPIDSKVYAVVKMTDDNNEDDMYDSYLVRFDASAFEYVAKLEEFSYSASFDRAGDFFMIAQTDSTRQVNPRQLYRYQKVHELAGFTNKAQAIDYSTGSDYVPYAYDYSVTPKTGHEKFADLAPLSADLEGIGNGSKQDYMISIGERNNMLIIKYADTDTGTEYQHWLLPVVASGDDNLQKGNKGAGWNYQDSAGNDKVYFTQNSGEGIAEVDLASINLGSSDAINVKILGKSIPTSRTDGLNCLNSALPFATCGHKNGPGTDAVSDDDCGQGMLYNPDSNDSTCAGSTCVVGGPDLSQYPDQDWCCTQTPVDRRRKGSDRRRKGSDRRRKGSVNRRRA